ncbi:hypothetical protein BKA83DRAFT_4127770 [Pisolithus microcarpus]|nr:hypothetical protein BKA83DRAFT_4127770 [Pisolithus microcarpus]
MISRSVPPPSSHEAMHATYEDYFVEHWMCKNREAYSPTTSIRLYCPEGRLLDIDAIRMQTAPVGSIIPQGACRQTHFSEGVYWAFLFLPRLCRCATDIYRAREARFQLGLPPIADNLLIESTTLLTTNANWNNQHLETLGDSVLKLITTVHIMNKYPHCHEGQLLQLQQSSVSNRTLLAHATEIGLERFLTSEGQNCISMADLINLEEQGCSIARQATKELSEIKVAVRAFGALLGEITAGQNNRVKTHCFLLDVIKASANLVAKHVQEGQWGRGGGTGEQSHACRDVNHKIEIASTNEGTSNG